jgi:hypothetical protein
MSSTNDNRIRPPARTTAVQTMSSANQGNLPLGSGDQGNPSNDPAHQLSAAPPSYEQIKIPGRWNQKAPRILDLSARGVSLTLGAGLVVSGAVGFFTGHNDGLTMLLVIGLLMILVPAIVDRLKSFEFNQLKVELVHQLDATGARKTADIFRRLGIDREIDAYATIFTELRGPGQEDVRASVLDQILRRVAAVSAVEEVDANEVQAMFFGGTPVVRMMALGLMEGDPRLINDQILLESIRHSASGNEQYHGMRLANLYWNRLNIVVRAEIKSAVASSRHLGPGRRLLAEEILKLS